MGGTVGFVVDLPDRKSFCPDAAFHVGSPSMKFIDGAPVFAVEVREENNITELPPKKKLPTSEPTILPPERKWYGTSTWNLSGLMSCASIAPWIPAIRKIYRLRTKRRGGAFRSWLDDAHR